MKKTTKQLIAILLALFMLTTSVPASVFAASADPESEEPAVETVIEEESSESQEEAPEAEAPSEEEVPAGEDQQEEIPAEEGQEAPETTEEQPQEAPETTEEQIQETEAAPAVSMPAVSFTDKVKLPGEGNKKTTLNVAVEAPEGAFAEGTKMVVTPVDGQDTLADSDKTVMEAVQETTEKEIVSVLAVDISFFDADGNPIEPAKEIKVSLKHDVLAEDKANLEDLAVVHIADDGKASVVETAVIDQQEKTAAFESDAFSVYAIVEKGSTEDEARATVNFYGKDPDTPEATYYVKNGDTPEELVYIVVDPYLDGLQSNEIFRGWSIDTAESDTDGPAYTETTKAMDIEEIRTYLADLSIHEGDTVNIYGMIFKYYNVSYYGDKQGVSLGTDTVIVKSSEDTAPSASYTVNMAFTPGSGDQDFEGWLVSEGSTNIEGYTEGKVYPNNTEITISGDVVFSVYAPRGQWLIFHEDGGTYVAPQFIKTGETTKEPSVTMRKLGYSFDGWYTKSGEEFVFGNTLGDRTELYARWSVSEKADYVVIIWKQNVNDNKNAADSEKTYDFGESITLNGNVGDAINTVSARGNGNNRYALVNGTAKQYPGFHLRTYDTGKTITPEGNQVINVYYDRNLVTLKFQYRSNGMWNTQATMTGLYGSSLASNGYTWPTNRWWYDDYGYWDGYYGKGTRTTFLDAFKTSDDASDATFYGFKNNGDTPVYFYKEDPEEAGTFKLANEVTTDGGTFYISDKYNGYKAVYYRKNGKDWTPLGGKDNDGYYAEVKNYDELQILYSPLKYNILYKDGIYVDGKGNKLDLEDMGQWKTVKDVLYESSTASYNKGGANYYDPSEDNRARDGFIFEGWYIDDQCTTPYNFTTMPEGITVYAKWRQIQYRVFLHPNVDASDTTLNWGIDNQQMSFLIPYGEKVSLPSGTRTNFEFIAWYQDEACTKLFDPDLISLTGATVTADYDQTEPTELDIWGNPKSNENKDAANNRYWVNKKLDLYGKWRAVLVGADGIGIHYDAGEGGSNAPRDNMLYLDQAGAIAQNASTGPDGKIFLYWVVQKWNGTAFEDTHVKVYPGDTFTVLKENAREQDITDGTQTEDVYKTFTIQLRAEYGEPDTATPTHITWYGNGGTNAGKIADVENKISNEGDTVTYLNLQINEKIPAAAPDTFTREGYKFIGWAREAEPEGAFDEESHTVDASKYSEKENLKLWLELNEDGETYTEVGTDHTNVTEVAADEKSPHHALYAVWEKRDTFQVYHTGLNADDEGVIETEYVDEYTDKPYDLTGNLTSGTLYGGYYLEGGFTAPADGKKYDGSNWKFATPQTANGTAITPVKDTTYYVKEVPESYLLPSQFETYYYFTGVEQTFYMVSTIDDDNYRSVGFKIAGVGNVAGDVYSSLKIKYGNHAAPDEATQNYKEALTVQDFSTNKSGYVFGKELSDFLEQGNAMIFRAYLVTPDGVEVTGVKYRRVKIDENPESVDEDGNPVVKLSDVHASDYNTKSKRTVVSEAAGSSSPKLSLYKTFSFVMPDAEEEVLSEPAEVEYIITKIEGQKVTAETVTAGDYTGKIGYTEKNGYLFAGWFTDEALTIPADFGNVNADMTVYAKYIKASDVSLSMERKNSKSVTVQIMVPADSFAEAGLGYDFGSGYQEIACNTKKTVSVRSFLSRRYVSYDNYSGTASVTRLRNGQSCRAYPYWITKDGTRVTGREETYQYLFGLFF